MRPHLALAATIGLMVPCHLFGGSPDTAPSNWQSWSPREEIAPHFAFNAAAGADGKGALVIEADKREGQYGCWKGEFPVEGGKPHRFSALYRAKGVANEERSIVARVLWRDADGKLVKHAEPTFTSYRPGDPPQAEPEYPQRKGKTDDWTEMSDTYLVPVKATKAIVCLLYTSDAADE